MQGSQEQPGIVPRAIEELYRLKHKMEVNGHYRVTCDCYMVQLYVDNLIDCFVTGGNSLTQLNQMSNKVKLEIREDPHTGMIQILNTTMISVTNFAEAT